MDLDTFVQSAIVVPFKERGRDHDGWDCWGLVVVFYRDLYRIDLPSYASEYNSTSNHRAMYRAVIAGKRLWERADTPALGDVALIYRRTLTTHVGVVLDDGSVLHTERQVGTVIEPPDRLRVEGYYRYVDQVRGSHA